MRKNIIHIGLCMTVAIALGCNKTDDYTDNGFKIVAKTIPVKTINDGLDTKWAASDKISVFHAVSASDNYVCDGEFILTDSGNGIFQGNLASALTDEKYDWYLIYPHKEGNMDPKEAALTIGSSTPVQSTADSMQHLEGETCPLYAIINDVEPNRTPGGEMQHLAAVVEFNVTNNTSENLTISEITFTASEDIVGNYLVDMTGSSPVLTKASDAEVSSEVTLSISENATLQPEESAKFYVAVKPFTAEAGVSLKVAVNDRIFNLTLENNSVFSAGKIKRLNIPYAAAGSAEEGSHTWDLSTASYDANNSGKYNVQWTGCEAVKMVLNKNGATMDANAWLADGTSRKATGAFKNQKLKFIPQNGMAITSIEITAISGYVNGLINAEYINGKMTYDGLLLTIIPEDGTQEIGIIPTEPCRMTAVTVTYVEESSYNTLEPPVISEVSADRHTVTVKWTDIAYAESYHILCGSLEETIAPGVGQAVFTGVENGEHVISVSSIKSGYKAGVAYSSITVDYSPSGAVLSEALIKAHFTNVARNVETYAEYVDPDQRITWAENCFCVKNAAYIQIRHDEGKTNSFVYLGMLAQLPIKKVTAAITAITPVSATALEGFNPYSGTISLYDAPDSTTPIISQTVSGSKSVVLEVPAEVEHKALYLRHSSTAAARIWGIEVQY